MLREAVVVTEDVEHSEETTEVASSEVENIEEVTRSHIEVDKSGRIAHVLTQEEKDTTEISRSRNQLVQKKVLLK